jgi:hypothetical protein
VIIKKQWAQIFIMNWLSKLMELCMTSKCGCENCGCPPKAIPITDNMGREIFWEDIGRKND